MWRLILILNLCFEFGSTDLVNGLQNTVVRVGQRMEMTCQADDNSTIREWSRDRLHTSKREIIFTNWKYRVEIRSKHFGIVERENSLVLLYKNSTEIDDAGIYICYAQREGRQRVRYSAHLIVFEAEPLCETNLSTSHNKDYEKGTCVWMRCSVNLTGSLVPTLEWRMNEGNEEKDEEPTDLKDWANAEFDKNVTISSTLSIALNPTNNSSFYSCRIYFPPISSRNNLVTASNSPNYSYEWKSPLVIFLPKAVISLTQLKGMTTDDSTKVMNHLAPSINVFNAIYLVGGVAVLFGITSSMIAIILCIRLRRKNSAPMEQNNSTTLEVSEYDLIPYACTEDYDKIEEVDEIDDILIANFPPRHGPLPFPGYSALMPDEPKPPGVYSRMDYEDESVEEEKNDVAEQKKLESDIDGNKHDYSNISDVEKTTMKMASPVSACSYLVLESEINVADDIVGEGEGIPSADLMMTYDPLPSNTKNNVQYAIQEYEIPSSYLTTRGIDSSAAQK